MESFGILQKKTNQVAAETEDSKPELRKDDLAVVEFGAGRGYLTQMLADCYNIRNVFLVERRSYKLKVCPCHQQKCFLKKIMKISLKILFTSFLFWSLYFKVIILFINVATCTISPLIEILVTAVN